jgi:hypothetical protein
VGAVNRTIAAYDRAAFNAIPKMGKPLYRVGALPIGFVTGGLRTGLGTVACIAPSAQSVNLPCLMPPVVGSETLQVAPTAEPQLD